MKKDGTIIYEYSPAGVKASILKNAKSLRLQDGWAEQISDKVVASLEKWIAKREVITENDLRFAIAKELDKYSNDLAFVYWNHGKII